LKINHLQAAEDLALDPDQEVVPEDLAPHLDPGLDLARQNVVVEETAAEVHQNVVAAKDLLNVAEVNDPRKEEIHSLKRILLKRALPFAVDEGKILPLGETHQMPKEAFPVPLKRMTLGRMEGVSPPLLKRRRKGRIREERHPAHALLWTKEVRPAPPLPRKSEEALLRNASRKNPQLLRGAARMEALVMQDPCREVLQEVQDQEVVAETRHLHDEEEKDVLEGAIPRPPLRCIN